MQKAPASCSTKRAQLGSWPKLPHSVTGPKLKRASHSCSSLHPLLASKENTLSPKHYFAYAHLGACQGQNPEVAWSDALKRQLKATFPKVLSEMQWDPTAMFNKNQSAWTLGYVSLEVALNFLQQFLHFSQQPVACLKYNFEKHSVII